MAGSIICTYVTVLPDDVIQAVSEFDYDEVAETIVGLACSLGDESTKAEILTAVAQMNDGRGIGNVGVEGLKELRDLINAIVDDPEPGKATP